MLRKVGLIKSSLTLACPGGVKKQHKMVLQPFSLCEDYFLCLIENIFKLTNILRCAKSYAPKINKKKNQLLFYAQTNGA
jgi:hypothetical protein